AADRREHLLGRADVGGGAVGKAPRQARLEKGLAGGQRRSLRTAGAPGRREGPVRQRPRVALTVIFAGFPSRSGIFGQDCQRLAAPAVPLGGGSEGCPPKGRQEGAGGLAPTRLRERQTAPTGSAARRSSGRTP